MKTALLIVDIQNFYFPGEGPGLVNAGEAAVAASKVLKVFRDKNLPVVHIRHQALKGFEIHSSVQPLSGEKVITKKEVNSFLGTDLLEYLKENNITKLVIIGMQTHMCLEAAVRAGHDFGFQCIVIKDACATKDLNFEGRVIKAEDVHFSTFAALSTGGYSKVIDLQEFLKNTDSYLTK
ncbi:MAG: cysteine hydrolase [Bacteroidetes bacterium HGW-Bacteroidetes-8]|nr:MAG: cysteine hydrolase [Bacteroidetes bacterium HGW-Bacteroidetes-8]